MGWGFHLRVAGFWEVLEGISTGWDRPAIASNLSFRDPARKQARAPKAYPTVEPNRAPRWSARDAETSSHNREPDRIVWEILP
jgi:hypothetical protein